MGGKVKFCQILKDERQKRNMSQEELANRLNVTRQTIVKWEKGDNYPDIINLISVSELFNISLDDLIGNTSEVEVVLESVEDAGIKNSLLLILGVLSLIIPYGTIGIFLAVYVKKSIEENQKIVRVICNISIAINLGKTIVNLMRNIAM